MRRYLRTPPPWPCQRWTIAKPKLHLKTLRRKRNYLERRLMFRQFNIHRIAQLSNLPHHEINNHFNTGFILNK